MGNYTYKKNHIPKSTPYNRRPDIKMIPQSITIHNTGNPTSTAANERSWLTDNPSNKRTASYHIVIDSIEAIECLPLNEVGWHAGDGSKEGSGNRTSIGIEICERDVKLGEYAQTLTNAVELVAKMLYERNWGINRLRRHYDWDRKNCPRMMNTDGKWTGWEQFKKRVEMRLNELSKPDQATVIVNGKELAVKGEIKDGVTRVPVRAIAEALGFNVAYEGKTKTVTITK